MPEWLGLCFLGAIGLLLTILWVVDWRNGYDD